MEKQLSNKVEKYVATFKSNIKDKIMELIFCGSEQEKEQRNMLIQYVLDYEPFAFEKEDFQKRKKQKNTIQLCERCCSKRADQEQCTRKKRPGFEYCGTHLKTHTNAEKTNPDPNTNPNTTQNPTSTSSPTTYKVEVFAQDIQGIVYFIDKIGNVYKTEDIMANKSNPDIVAKYTKENNLYSISEFLANNK
jgi:hypothetical protein